jgi:hypothetical protein
MGHILYLTITGLGRLESSYRSRNSKGPEANRTLLLGNCLRGVHYSFLRQCRASSSYRDRKATLTSDEESITSGDKEGTSTGVVPQIVSPGNGKSASTSRED